jgi:methylglutaconyl-CoA hydratase
MVMATHLHIETREHGAAWITLMRREKHNAFDEQLIAELTAALRECESDEAVTSVVLAADGKNFSAGADLDWMRRAALQTREQNIADAQKLAALMRTLDELPKPTIALAHGSTFGGGVGLVACCDIAIAATDARFCFSETKLGLVPAVISPFVIAAIGARNARRYFQTAEVFGAEIARAIGLVQEVVSQSDLKERGLALTATLSTTAPGAKAASKRLVRNVVGHAISDIISDLTAREIADTRANDEAKEGIAAFFEKRKARWQP